MSYLKKIGYLSSIIVFIHRFKIKIGFYKLILPIKNCPIPEDLKLRRNYKDIKLPNRWGLESSSKCIDKADKFLFVSLLISYIG